MSKELIFDAVEKPVNEATMSSTCFSKIDLTHDPGTAMEPDAE